MKIVTEEKYIPATTRTITKYIASDGAEFFDKDFCLRHEHSLELKNSTVFNSMILARTFCDDEPVSLYYISNEDDYKFLIEKVYLSQCCMWNSDFYERGPGWYLLRCESGGDSEDTYYLCNYDAHIKNIEDQLQKYKEEMSEKMNSKVQT